MQAFYFKVILLCALALLSPMVLAADIPLEEQAFTRMAAERMKRELPAYGF